MKKMGVCTWMFYKPAPAVFLESVGAVTSFGSLLCPSQAPDQVKSMKKSSWFKITNSCGLAGNSFGEPDFSAPDLALGCSVLAGYAGFLTLLDS